MRGTHIFNGKLMNKWPRVFVYSMFRSEGIHPLIIGMRIKTLRMRVLSLWKCPSFDFHRDLFSLSNALFWSNFSIQNQILNSWDGRTMIFFLTTNIVIRYIFQIGTIPVNIPVLASTGPMAAISQPRSIQNILFITMWLQSANHVLYRTHYL